MEEIERKASLMDLQLGRNVHRSLGNVFIKYSCSAHGFSFTYRSTVIITGSTLS